MAKKKRAAEEARPNLGHVDLRDYLERRENAGDLLRIDGAHWNLEIGALQETLYRALGQERSAPVLLFENIPGSPKGFRAVNGLVSTNRRVAAVLGFPETDDPVELVQGYRDRMKGDFQAKPPEFVDSGPVFENIERDDEVDLMKFPAPFLHEEDGGRYIGTDDLVIIRDYDTDWINTATYRIQLHNKNTLGIWMSPGKHGRIIREKYFSRDEPCPVAISLGHDPLLFLASSHEVDYGTDEVAYAAGHRDRPFQMVRSELHGLPIPAHSEIVVEGEIYGDETMAEGPFGEFMGYYASDVSDEPIIKVRRVYYRNNPILGASGPGRPPTVTSHPNAVIKSAMIWDEVEKAGLPGVKGVWCHACSGRGAFKVIAIEQLYPGHAKQAAMLATNVHSGNYAGRWTVVVDDDIDPSNLFDVVWAMSTRCDPPEDIDYIRRTWSTPLDPLLREPPYQTNQAVIDACRPWGWKDEFPKVAEASPELKAKMREKFAHLFEK